MFDIKRSEEASIADKKSSENYLAEDEVATTPVLNVKGKSSFSKPIVDEGFINIKFASNNIEHDR